MIKYDPITGLYTLTYNGRVSTHHSHRMAKLALGKAVAEANKPYDDSELDTGD